MTAFAKVPESKAKVRFHDCDPYNHLNNSRYIDYIVSARGDQLIEYYGFDMYALTREEGIGWVSAQTQISYLAPAFLMEEVVIQTQLLGYSDKSLHLEGIMWNADKSQIKAVMWAKLVHFDLRKQRSRQHSEGLMEFFHQILNPLPAPLSFEERVQTLRQTTTLKVHS